MVVVDSRHRERYSVVPEGAAFSTSATMSGKSGGYAADFANPPFSMMKLAT
jgi:hypothetical protein